jgi:putative phage-type endonuclease
MWLDSIPVLLPHLIQGSPEWHLYRAKQIGASDVPAIMGKCDFRTPYDVFLTKMPDYEPGEQTWPMIRGHALEPITLARFEMIHGCKLTNPILKKGNIHASLDGWWVEEKLPVEAKAPALWKHTQALCGIVPDTYEDQLQTQMYVAESDKAYYLSFHPDEPESHQYAEIIVYRDDKRIKEILEVCSIFWEKVLRREWYD